MNKTKLLGLLSDKLGEDSAVLRSVLDTSLTILSSMGIFIKVVPVNSRVIDIPEDFVALVSIKEYSGNDVEYYMTDKIYITGTVKRVYHNFYDSYSNPWGGAESKSEVYLLTYKFRVNDDVPDNRVDKVMDYVEYLYYTNKLSGVLKTPSEYPSSITDSDGDMSTTVNFASSNDLSQEYQRLAQLALDRFQTVEPYLIRG